MKAFRVRIAVFELVRDNFTALIDYDESCKQEDLKTTLSKLTKLIKEFIEKNNISGDKNEKPIQKN